MYIYMCGCVYICAYVYIHLPTHMYIELVHVTIETEKSPNRHGESEPADQGQPMV